MFRKKTDDLSLTAPPSNRSVRDDKELGNNYPKNGLVKAPRRDTRALSPAGMFKRKGASPLSGPEKQTARAISAFVPNAYLISL
jgi:hypothetical protein